MEEGEDSLEAAESALNSNRLGLGSAVNAIGTRFDAYGGSGYGVTAPASGYSSSGYGGWDSYGYAEPAVVGSYGGGYGHKRPNNVKINLGGNLKIRNPFPTRPLRFRFNTMFPGISELKFRIPGLNLNIGGITDIDICPDILLAALIAAAAAFFYATYLAITGRGRRRRRPIRN